MPHLPLPRRKSDFFLNIFISRENATLLSLYFTAELCASSYFSFLYYIDDFITDDYFTYYIFFSASH